MTNTFPCNIARPPTPRAARHVTGVGSITVTMVLPGHCQTPITTYRWESKEVMAGKGDFIRNSHFRYVYWDSICTTEACVTIHGDWLQKYNQAATL
jgi:hypothetical protein